MSTVDRERLKDICEWILDAAIDRINDPRNVAKGDDWTDESWGYLVRRHFEESEESTHEINKASGGHENNMLPEFADELVFRAMTYDKWLLERQLRKDEARREQERAAEEA